MNLAKLLVDKSIEAFIMGLEIYNKRCISESYLAIKIQK